ncbi:F-box/WD repeat-containing protein 7-like [Ctenocephalides felis]|uniref:F-box/WD repeat-containing protein 7-like n=1 Tax=Ctenocephalides felis TaxID=7515 RepID=UPI000E6E4C67|nr:F-box/WD repeat-containing protein 7-like [Ctenocephalides felis]
MDPACSSNSGNFSKVVTDTPPFTCTGKAQGAATINEETQTEDVMIIDNPNPTPVSECSNETEQIIKLAVLGLRPSMKQIIDSNESECLDRRKATNSLSDCHYLTDIPNLEKLEREDFSKENALINVNHSSLINVFELIEDKNLASKSNSQIYRPSSSKCSSSQYENFNEVVNYPITSTPQCSQKLSKILEFPDEESNKCDASATTPQEDSLSDNKSVQNAMETNEDDPQPNDNNNEQSTSVKSPPLTTTPKSIFSTSETLRKLKCSGYIIKHDASSKNKGSENIVTTPKSSLTYDMSRKGSVKINLSKSLDRIDCEAGPSSSASRLCVSDPGPNLDTSANVFEKPADVNLCGVITIDRLSLENNDNTEDNDVAKDGSNNKQNEMDENLDIPEACAAINEPDQDLVVLEAREVEIEYEDDSWADCEDGSDEEEVCTCSCLADSSQEDESDDDLITREIDVSHNSEIDTITQSELLQESHNMIQARVHRKRKLEDECSLPNKKSFSDDSILNRSMLEESAIRKNSEGGMGYIRNVCVTPSGHVSSTGEKKTPRSVIPSKENPPPEMTEWLLQFLRWSHAERLLAVDQLIERCEPQQVRHMMQVIEPQFQRDFISLLPKELALNVLSFLEPRDLLRAAQTCRSWRFLADDNLLWKEKCRQAGIHNVREQRRNHKMKLVNTRSPWKAAYMRQHTIEMNWRSAPVRPPKVLKGHDDHVITCLQFSGNRIVSGSDDNTLKVWSAVTGKCLRTLVGHTGGVWSSQMSGSVIISGSTDRTLKVWDADTGECTHTLYGHTSTVRCMHLHDHKVVSGSRDATLRVWDITHGTCLHVLVGHLAAVRCVQYDGRLVVSGAYDYMVKVWNPEREECLHTLQGHTNRVYSLQFDGIHVVSGSLDTSIRVWEVESGSCKHTLMGHQSLTSGMELRNNILVSGNADSTVKVWDIISGQCLQTLSGPNKHQSAVTCLQFNSRFVITSSDDGTVKLWDVKTGEFIRNLVALSSGGSGGVVWRIRANETKLICAVGSRNGTEETKLMVLDFDVKGACLKCS